MSRGSSKNRLNIQDKSIFKKRVSNQVPSDSPKARDDPIFKRGKGTYSPNEKPTCAICRKGHLGE